MGCYALSEVLTVRTPSCELHLRAYRPCQRCLGQVSLHTIFFDSRREIWLVCSQLIYWRYVLALSAAYAMRLLLPFPHLDREASSIAILLYWVSRDQTLHCRSHDNHNDNYFNQFSMVSHVSFALGNRCLFDYGWNTRGANSLHCFIEWIGFNRALHESCVPHGMPRSVVDI